MVSPSQGLAGRSAFRGLVGLLCLASLVSDQPLASGDGGMATASTTGPGVVPVSITDGGTAPISKPRADASEWEQTFDVRQFRVVERDSGPINYYETILNDPDGPLIRAKYRPPLESVTLGVEIPERLRQKVRRLRWRWRVLTFPLGGSDCIPGKADSAAAIYVTFKRGLKFYIIKYAWASVGTKGTVCDRRNNLFIARETVLQEVDGPTSVWIREQIQPRWEFVKHFGGRLDEVPDLVGIGIMSDGDQTQSRVEADYADFSVEG